MSDDDTRQTLEELRAELARSRQQVADMAAAQEEFLRAVSHDLRAPLRHVTSYGTLVREVLGDLPAGVVQAPELQEALGFLATMDQSARRMGLMMDGLLALVRAGRAPLRCEAIALADAVAQARATLAAAEAGRTVQWHLDAGLPVLQADASLLQELLVQVLGNALKFTRGQDQAQIRMGAEPLADGRVAVTVRDNGVGFDPARAGSLFGVFQRLHRETEFEGVGTGLALCRVIAQRHGAQLTADATPGAGCQVRLEWPASPSGL
ncbi:sensor histidine kinase [Acidovorax sp.]|uniref:sensor histidine kinase n=1 Tax=Acidovorax sp. TaxID=1872122 RepID=UPI002ACEBCA7|nr:ATP-binding protein [Acidovorax sp.]MDZ7866986.1 ATP-binding protein [Acidovorax sp.]